MLGLFAIIITELYFILTNQYSDYLKKYDGLYCDFIIFRFFIVWYKSFVSLCVYMCKIPQLSAIISEFIFRFAEYIFKIVKLRVNQFKYYLVSLIFIHA